MSTFFQWRLSTIFQCLQSSYLSTIFMEPLGTHVRIQDKLSGLWDCQGKVIQEQRDSRSFIVKCGNRHYARNRKFLRIIDEPQPQPDADERQAEAATGPRRSRRVDEQQLR